MQSIITVRNRDGERRKVHLLTQADFAEVGALHLDSIPCVYELVARSFGSDDRVRACERFDLSTAIYICELSRLVIDGGPGSKDDPIRLKVTE